MIPILFEHDATSFTGHGLGDLVDAVSCTVEANDSNTYEMELVYPMTGALYSEIQIERIIVVKPNYRDNNQAFRIYGFENNINGLVTIKCQHLSYDLNNIMWFAYDRDSYLEYYGKPAWTNYFRPGELISDLTVSDFLSTPNPFIFHSSVPSGTSWPIKTYLHIEEPTSVRNILMGSNKSLQSNFGGIFTFDNFHVYYTLYSVPNGGHENQVRIEYGKDLVDFKQEENISEMCTAILPYFVGKDRRYDGQSWGGPESVVLGDVHYAEGNFPVQHILPVNVNSYFAKSDTVDEDIWDGVSPGTDWIPLKRCVDNVGRRLLQKGEYGVPEINLTLKSSQVSEDIRLYDIVIVKFPKLGINVSARVSSMKYDALKEEIIEIEIGKSRDYLTNKRWGWEMEYINNNR